MGANEAREGPSTLSEIFATEGGQLPEVTTQESVTVVAESLSELTYWGTALNVPPPEVAQNPEPPNEVTELTNGTLMSPAHTE